MSAGTGVYRFLQKAGAPHQKGMPAIVKPNLSHLECTGKRTEPLNKSSCPEQRARLETACEKRRLPRLAGNAPGRDSRKQRSLLRCLRLPASGSYLRNRTPNHLAVPPRPTPQPFTNPSKLSVC